MIEFWHIVLMFIIAIEGFTVFVLYLAVDTVRMGRNNKTDYILLALAVMLMAIISGTLYLFLEEYAI